MSSSNFLFSFPTYTLTRMYFSYRLFHNSVTAKEETMRDEFIWILLYSAQRSPPAFPERHFPATRSFLSRQKLLHRLAHHCHHSTQLSKIQLALCPLIYNSLTTISSQSTSALNNCSASVTHQALLSPVPASHKPSPVSISTFSLSVLENIGA